MASVEVNRMLQGISERAYKLMVKDLNAKLAKLEERIAHARSEIMRATEARRRVDWLSEFLSEVDKLDKLSDQGKCDYLQGLIKGIDGRCNEAEKAHELTIHMQLPIIEAGTR